MIKERFSKSHFFFVNNCWKCKANLFIRNCTERPTFPRVGTLEKWVGSNCQVSKEQIGQKRK